VVEPYVRPKALQYLEEGKSSCLPGTATLLHTDTAAALRGAEIGAQVVLKATKSTASTARPQQGCLGHRYAAISFDQVIAMNLQVMDATAFRCAATRSCRSGCSASSSPVR